MEKGKKSSKNQINYNYLVTSSMTSPSWIIPHMKALNLKFVLATRLSLATTWWHSRAIRKKSKNGFSATSSGLIWMTYILKEWKFNCDSGNVCIMTFRGQRRSNFGQKRQIRVKSGRLVEIYLLYICFDSKFCPKFKFEILKVKSDHQRVKLGSKSSNQGQIRVKSGKLVEIYPINISFDS